MFDQVFLISNEPDPNQPINRNVMFKIVDSTNGRAVLSPHRTSREGTAPFDEASTLIGIKKLLRERIDILNAGDSLSSVLGSFEKDTPIDLSVSSDEQKLIDAAKAQRDRQVALLNLQVQEVLVRNKVIAETDAAYIDAVDTAKTAVVASDVVIPVKPVILG